MADEISQVPQTGVNPLWPITGAVVGGAGTAYGLNKAGYSSSPYKSVEDLIKEKEDTFNGKKVNGDAQTKAVDKAKATVETAAAKYDADLKAYQEANKFGVQETPEFKELVAKQQAAEKALAEKRAELEKIGTDVKPAEVSPRAQQALDKVKKEIEAEKKKLEDFSKIFNESLKTGADEQLKLLNEVEELQAQLRKETDPAKVSALKTQLSAKRANLKQAEAELDKMCNDVATMMINQKGKKSEIAALREAKAKEIKNTVQDIIAERTNNESIVKNNVRDIETSRTQAFRNINDTIGKDLAKADAAEVEKQVGRHVKVEQNKLAKLEKFKELYAEAEKKAKISGGETTLTEEIKKFLGLFTKTKTSTTIKSAENMFADSLTTKEAEDFFRLVKGGTDSTAVDKAIEESKAKIQTLENSLSNIKTANAQIVKLGGEGAYIRGGILYGADGKQVEFKPTQIKLANDVEFPATRRLRGLQHQQEKIEAEIAGKSGEKLTAQEIEAKLANEVKAAQDAKAAVETARAGLPKTAEKTAKELEAEFAKTNGTKKEAITKALKESEAELKPLFEKKWGNGKVAAAVAGGAAVVGLLSYLVAPKGDRA